MGMERIILEPLVPRTICRGGLTGAASTNRARRYTATTWGVGH